MKAQRNVGQVRKTANGKKMNIRITKEEVSMFKRQLNKGIKNIKNAIFLKNEELDKRIRILNVPIKKYRKLEDLKYALKNILDDLKQIERNFRRIKIRD